MTAASTWVELGDAWTDSDNWYNSTPDQKYTTFEQEVDTEALIAQESVRGAHLAEGEEVSAQVILTAESTPPHSADVLAWPTVAITAIDVDILPAPVEASASHSIQALTTISARKPFDNSVIEIVVDRPRLHRIAYQQRKMLVVKQP